MDSSQVARIVIVQKKFKEVRLFWKVVVLMSQLFLVVLGLEPL